MEYGNRFVNGPTSDKQQVMSNKKTSSDDDSTPRDDDSTEILATDPDPVQIADTIDESLVESRAADEPDPESGPASEEPSEAATEKPSSPASVPRAGRPWFGVFIRYRRVTTAACRQGQQQPAAIQPVAVQGRN